MVFLILLILHDQVFKESFLRMQDPEAVDEELAPAQTQLYATLSRWQEETGREAQP